MKRKHFLFLILLVLMCTRIAISQSYDTTQPPVIAFVDVNVIPMTSAELLQHQTVLVEGGLITRIGPADQVKAPENALRIDGSNRYLLPGLVDAHVHLETALGARPHFGDAPLFLANGVTTVVNLRGFPEHLKLRDEIRDGLLLAPNLYTSGEFVEEPRVRTTQEAEREVEAQVRAGYDVIKIHETPATTTGMDLPTYRAVLQSARRLDVPVVGHIPVGIGLQTAIREHQNLAHVVMYVLGYFVPVGEPSFPRFGACQRV